MMLFALVCENGRREQAVEICEMMLNQHTIQVAIGNAICLRFVQHFDNVTHKKLEDELLRANQDEDEKETLS